MNRFKNNLKNRCYFSAFFQASLGQRYFSAFFPASLGQRYFSAFFPASLGQREASFSRRACFTLSLVW